MKHHVRNDKDRGFLIGDGRATEHDKGEAEGGAGRPAMQYAHQFA